MTEQAQPPGVGRAADDDPGSAAQSAAEPAGHQPSYHEPSYSLPAEHAPTAGPAGWGEPPAVGAASGSAATDGPQHEGSAGAGHDGTGAAAVDRPDAGAVMPSSGPGTSQAVAPVAAIPIAGTGVPAGRWPVPAPPRESSRAPSRVDPVPGTPYGLVFLGVPPVTSGPAVASLVTGIAALLVAFVVGCFGILGGPEGWGGWVAGAFALLGILLGLAGLLLGELGRRQTAPAGRRNWPVQQLGSGPAGEPSQIRYSGRGLAISGMVCAGLGLLLTVLALLGAVLLQLV